MHPIDASDFSEAESEVVTASALVLMLSKSDRKPKTYFIKYQIGAYDLNLFPLFSPMCKCLEKHKPPKYISSSKSNI